MVVGLFNADFTAQSAVGNGHCVIQCTSQRPSSHLPKHIPAMPKQAGLPLPPPPLTAAHFSCALKFNSVPCRAPPLSPTKPPPTLPHLAFPPLLPLTPQQRLFVDRRDFIFLVIPPPVSTCGGGCIILRATGLCERARTLHQCPELSYFIFVFVSSVHMRYVSQVYDLR